MAKFADYNALDRWKDKIIDAIDEKAKATHRHSLINGKTIVISDTIPTVNDESVITLIVDTAHVPVTAIDLQETHVNNAYVTLLSGTTDGGQTLLVEYTFDALIDGEPVLAEYQLEREKYDGSRIIMREYSSNNNFSYLISPESVFYVKVRAGGVTKEFSITTPTASRHVLAPVLNYTGVYVDNQLDEDSNVPYDVLPRSEFRYSLSSSVLHTEISKIELFAVEYSLDGFKGSDGIHHYYSDWEGEEMLSAVTDPVLKVCDLVLDTDLRTYYGSLDPVHDMVSGEASLFLVTNILSKQGDNIYTMYFVIVSEPST